MMEREKQRILSNSKLTDMEKLRKVFDINKDFLKEYDSQLYYAILAVLDEEKKPDASGYFNTQKNNFKKNVNMSNERYAEFEYTLYYMLMEIDDEISEEDLSFLQDIQQSVIVFSMKDKFEETNEIFLDNAKNDFYNSIKKLEENHPCIKNQTEIVKRFMEDFYFNN